MFGRELVEVTGAVVVDVVLDGSDTPSNLARGATALDLSTASEAEAVPNTSDAREKAVVAARRCGETADSLDVDVDGEPCAVVTAGATPLGAPVPHGGTDEDVAGAGAGEGAGAVLCG